MKLIFDDVDLLAIDGLDLVDMDWPAAPSREVVELALPAADGAYFMNAVFNPIDVTFKFRMDAFRRDYDAIMGMWARLNSRMMSKGMRELTVSRAISIAHNVPNPLPQFDTYIDLTYDAVPVTASNVEFSGYAGEASITFRIPFPVGEDREHAWERTVGFIWEDDPEGSDPVEVVYNADVPHYGGQIVIDDDIINAANYAPKIEFEGRLYFNLEYMPESGTADIHMYDTLGYSMSEAVFSLPLSEILPTGQFASYNLSVDIGNRMVRASASTPIDEGNSWPVMPSLDSSWLDFPDGVYRADFFYREETRTASFIREDSTLKIKVTPRWI